MVIIDGMVILDHVSFIGTRKKVTKEGQKNLREIQRHMSEYLSEKKYHANNSRNN